MLFEGWRLAGDRQRGLRGPSACVVLQRWWRISSCGPWRCKGAAPTTWVKRRRRMCQTGRRGAHCAAGHVTVRVPPRICQRSTIIALIVVRHVSAGVSHVCGNSGIACAGTVPTVWSVRKASGRTCCVTDWLPYFSTAPLLAAKRSATKVC